MKKNEFRIIKNNKLRYGVVAEKASYDQSHNNLDGLYHLEVGELNRSIDPGAEYFYLSLGTFPEIPQPNHDPCKHILGCAQAKGILNKIKKFVQKKQLCGAIRNDLEKILKQNISKLQQDETILVGKLSILDTTFEVNAYTTKIRPIVDISIDVGYADATFYFYEPPGFEEKGEVKFHSSVEGNEYILQLKFITA